MKRVLGIALFFIISLYSMEVEDERVNVYELIFSQHDYAGAFEAVVDGRAQPVCMFGQEVAPVSLFKEALRQHPEDTQTLTQIITDLSQR